MKAHEKSDIHVQATQAALALEGARSEGSIIQQLQRVESQERMKNRAAIKSLIRCTHFLARNHIAHTTIFDQLVDLVVSCDSEPLKYFMEKAGKNATYTSHVTIAEFVEAIGICIEEVMLEHLRKASYYRGMADVCTDIATVEELSVYCRWVEVEHFLEIINLPKGDAGTIYSALIDCLKQKNLHVKNIVGMGFDGANALSGNRNGVQARVKKLAPHALFVLCHWHMLQLACV